MTWELIAPDRLWTSVSDDLLSTPQLERAAVGFAGTSDRHGRKQLLLRDWAPVPDNEYIVQLGYHLEVAPSFWARHAKRARESGEALLLLHSHPGSPGTPQFSASDDAGEELLIPKIQQRARVPVAAVVVGPSGASSRIWPPGAPSAVPLAIHSELAAPNMASRATRPAERFDRQVRALGSAAQRRLQEMRIGVVGLGGLGSHVAQQLAHLGAGSLTLIDPDTVERSNVSRIVGVRRTDPYLRRRKVDVARRTARRIGGVTKIRVVARTLFDPAVQADLLECDVVFGCTDTQASRAALNEIAFQHYVPVIDLGVELQLGGAMGGRVSWLLPGSACLWCQGVLDPERVRIEQLPPALRIEEHQRGYISGVDEPAPAVVSINGVIASLGVTEMLAVVTEFAGARSERPTMLLYRLADGTTRRTRPVGQPSCPTCSADGLLGVGTMIGPGDPSARGSDW